MKDILDLRLELHRFHLKLALNERELRRNSLGLIDVGLEEYALRQSVKKVERESEQEGKGDESQRLRSERGTTFKVRNFD